MANDTSSRSIVPTSKLSPTNPLAFDLRMGDAAVLALRDRLGLIDLRKLRFHGKIVADGRDDWHLSANLGATITQSCVITLEPVRTRIEETVIRRFLKAWPPAEEEGNDVKMPEDDTIEQLGAEIDIKAVMSEALALALPDYPRKDGMADCETAFEAQAHPPGTDPTDTGPTAAFAELRKMLEGDGH